MDLSVYKNVDPDVLLSAMSNYQVTFFYIPETDELLYDTSGMTHQEMLEDSDKVFDKVYPQLAKLPSIKKKPYRSRGIVLLNSKALLGRLALYEGDVIVALWNPLTNPHINAFKKKLLEVFPKFKKGDIILTGKEHKPELMNNPNKSAAQNVKSSVGFNPQAADRGSYQIGGQEYTKQELQKLRSAWHTKSLPQAQLKAVLCHPDIERYPELQGYRPPACDHVPSSRYRDRSLDPYAGSYGESFRAFLESKP